MTYQKKGNKMIHIPRMTLEHRLNKARQEGREDVIKWVEDKGNLTHIRNTVDTDIFSFEVKVKEWLDMKANGNTENR